MKRVVIAGGGVSGLVSNHVLKAYSGLDVKLLEPGRVGGEFLSGGLKYIHHTDGMTEMFDKLDILYSDYVIQGGILLKEKVESYPGCFKDMDPEQAARVQADHYRKTRKTEPGEFGKKAMNDPASVKPRRALKCNFNDMIVALARQASIIKAAVTKIEGNSVLLSTGERMPFDHLILTIPMWITRDVAPWEVPVGIAARLNVAVVKPARDHYARWDYVYTPYTPADAVHRFSPHGGGYAVEVNGVLDKDALRADLDFIYKDGWAVESLREGLKGHLLPLEFEPKWPANVAPLGRFAKWDPRATTDDTLVESQRLAREWFGEPR